MTHCYLCGIKIQFSLRSSRFVSESVGGSRSRKGAKNWEEGREIFPFSSPPLPPPFSSLSPRKLSFAYRAGLEMKRLPTQAKFD